MKKNIPESIPALKARIKELETFITDLLVNFPIIQEFDDYPLKDEDAKASD